MEEADTATTSRWGRRRLAVEETEAVREVDGIAAMTVTRSKIYENVQVSRGSEGSDRDGDDGDNCGRGSSSNEGQSQIVGCLATAYIVPCASLRIYQCDVQDGAMVRPVPFQGSLWRYPYSPMVYGTVV